MTRFTLTTLQTSDGPKAAMGINDKYHLLSLVEPLLVDATCKSILQSWDASMLLLQGLAEKIAAGHVAQQRGVDTRTATVLTPVLDPDTLLAVGANYPKGDQSKTGGSTSMAFFIRPPKTTLGRGD